MVSNIGAATAKTAPVPSLPIWSCYPKNKHLEGIQQEPKDISGFDNKGALCIHPTPAPPMSDEGSVASRDELVEEDYEEEDDASVDDMSHDARSKDGQDADDVDYEEEETGDILDDNSLILQHGAHREYSVPEAFILHKAKANMVVKDGKQMGELVCSKSFTKWRALLMENVYIIGGRNKMTGKVEQAPYVIFEPEGCDTSDDSRWLRPIPITLMEPFQNQWKKEIDDRYGKDSEKAKRKIDMYDMVLSWTPSKLDGQRLHPERLGVGKGGFVLLTKKPKSIKVAPGVVPRNAKGDNTDRKSKKARISDLSTLDNASDTSEFTTVSGAKTVLLGDVGSVQCFTLKGKLYATTIA